MKGFVYRIVSVSGLAFLFLFLSNNTYCITLPQEELVVYKAMIPKMSDQELVQKYKEEFSRLQKTFKETTKDVANTSISQLPIFKVALLKAITNEIKNRQEKTHKNLLSSEQIKSADKLISDKETSFKEYKKKG